MHSFLSIGNIIKPHGIHGVLKFKADVFLNDSFLKTKKLFLTLNGQNIPQFVQKIEAIGNDFYLISLEEFANKNQALPFAKSEVLLAENDYQNVVLVHEEIANFQFLIGYEIYNESKVYIGIVNDVIQLSQNNLIATTVSDNEVLIPLHQDLIIDMDKPKRKLILTIPEGLINLYQQ